MRAFSVIILACFVCIAVGLGGYFAPTFTTISYKHLYADHVKDEIDVFIKEHLQGELNLPTFCEKLKERFKIVKEVEWKWDYLGHSMITVEGILPDKYNFIKKVPESYWSSYTVSYSSQNCSFLTKRTRAPFVPSAVHPECPPKLVERRPGVSREKMCMIISDETLSNDDKVKATNFVHDDFVKKSKSKSAAYDLRFKNRIYAKAFRNRLQGG